MKKALAALLLAASSIGVAWACTTTTIINANGEVVICTTCCDNMGNCTVTCY